MQERMYYEILAKAVISNADEIVKAIDQYLAKVDEDLEQTLSDEGVAETKETVKEINAIQEEIASVLDGQTNEIYTLLEQLKSAEATVGEVLEGIEGFIENDSINIDIEDILLSMYEKTVVYFSSAYLKNAEEDLSVKKLLKSTQYMLEKTAYLMGTNIAETSHNKIRAFIEGEFRKPVRKDSISELVQQTVSAGEGIDKLVRKIIDGGFRESYYEARRVAVTEVSRVHSIAREEAIQQSPASGRKKWVHSGAHKNSPRENHVQMNGQIVDKEEPFLLKGRDGSTYYPMYPLDSVLPAAEVINCHCTHVPIVDGAIKQMPASDRRQMQEENRKAADVKWKEPDVDYMSVNDKPKYGKESKLIANGQEIEVKKVVSSKFEMYTDVDATVRNMAVRLTEKNLSKVAERLPSGMSMPRIAVIDFGKTESMKSNAIAAYDKEQDTMYVNSLFRSDKAIMKYMSGVEGYFARTDALAPYLHELGHKYHYFVIETIAKAKNISYTESKAMYEESIIEYIKGRMLIDAELVKNELSRYAQFAYKKGNYDRRMNEIMAEWFTVRHMEQPSELVRAISENERRWMAHDDNQ